MGYMNGVKIQTDRPMSTSLGLQTYLSFSLANTHTHTHTRTQTQVQCSSVALQISQTPKAQQLSRSFSYQAVQMTFRKTTFLLEISLAVSQFPLVNASDLYSEGVRSTYLTRLYVFETLQRISKYLFVASNNLQRLCRISFPVNYSFIIAGIALVYRPSTNWKMQSETRLGKSFVSSHLPEHR